MRISIGKDSGGSVAILSLWVIVMLAFLAIALGHGVQQKVAVFKQLHERFKSQAAGESAAKRVIAEIGTFAPRMGGTALADEWYHNRLGSSRAYSAGENSSEFVIEDESAKINLNKADQNQLVNLFCGIARVEAGKADRLAKAVIDFRDQDDFVTGEQDNAGSENDLYRQAGFIHGPKNSDFEFIEELLLVEGMTKEIYDFVRNYITIYGSGEVNINTCTREALSTLDLLSEIADKIVTVRNGPDRRSLTSDDFIFKDVSKIDQDLLAFVALSEDEQVSLRHAVLYNMFCVDSNYFRIKGRTRKAGQSDAGKLVCIVGVRDGVKYWAEA